MFKGYYGHFVPKARELDDYPLVYSIEELVEEPKDYIEVDFMVGQNFSETIKEALINKFPYVKYLSRFSTSDISEYEVMLKVNVCSMEQVEGRKTKQKVVNSSGFLRAYDFKSDYQFTLIETQEQADIVLNEALEDTENLRVGFDTETTGLNPEVDNLVGISFAFKHKQGYYFPFGHRDYNNLDKSVVNQIYSVLKQAKCVYMYNARFDIRVIEYFNPELTFDEVNFVDTQINTYLADPDWKGGSLKWTETHFLGYKRLDLKDTLKTYGIDSFDTSYLSPYNITFYACQDAISTLELGHKTDVYQAEFKLSGELDQAIILPIMRMENNPVRIDAEYLEEQIVKLREQLEVVDSKIKASIGDINLRSPKQMVALFESFNLDTGVKTKTGAMSVGTEAVNKMIKRYKAEGKAYPSWLTLLERRSKLSILLGTFFEKFYEYVKESGGKARLHYRLGSTATGRFSSGEER